MYLMYWIVHEVIILWSEPKRTHLALSSIPPFIVTITILVEYGCSFISRPDFFCNGKCIVAPTFQTSVKQIFKCFCFGFSSCLMTHFTIFLAESKTECSKIGSIFVLTFFSLYLKINMDKHQRKLQKTKGVLRQLAKAGKTIWIS